jgi:hypothetical protein
MDTGRALGGQRRHGVRRLEEICAAVATQWQAFPTMQHATSNHTVEINDDVATGGSDVVVMVELPDRQWLVGGAPTTMSTASSTAPSESLAGA